MCGVAFLLTNMYKEHWRHSLLCKSVWVQNSWQGLHLYCKCSDRENPKSHTINSPWWGKAQTGAAICCDWLAERETDGYNLSHAAAVCVCVYILGEGSHPVWAHSSITESWITWPWSMVTPNEALWKRNVLSLISRLEMVSVSSVHTGNWFHGGSD